MSNCKFDTPPVLGQQHGGDESADLIHCQKLKFGLSGTSSEIIQGYTVQKIKKGGIFIRLFIRQHIKKHRHEMTETPHQDKYMENGVIEFYFINTV